jgi:hypothetical protein
VDDAPEKFPPEEWFAAVAGGRPARVAFIDINGDAELVRADWVEGNIFELAEVPLLVDEATIGDRVEVEWREGDLGPHFVRLSSGGWGARTIRSRATPDEVERFLRASGQRPLLFEPHRYECGIFVTAVRPEALNDYEEFYDSDVLDILPGRWAFTDTGEPR